jgi:hypothetical protein
MSGDLGGRLPSGASRRQPPPWTCISRADTSRHEPDRVPDSDVRQLPLGDQLVDRRLREPQRPRHVGDRQQAVSAPERQQQTSSKISAIAGEPWRNSSPARNAAASLSKTLRTRNRTCTLSDSPWGASGRWFKSSRPDHLKAAMSSGSPTRRGLLLSRSEKSAPPARQVAVPDRARRRSQVTRSRDGTAAGPPPPEGRRCRGGRTSRA